MGGDGGDPNWAVVDHNERPRLGRRLALPRTVGCGSSCFSSSYAIRRLPTRPRPAPFALRRLVDRSGRSAILSEPSESPRRPDRYPIPPLLLTTMSQPSLGTRPLAGNLKACYRVCQPEMALPAGDPYYTDRTASDVRGSVPVMRRIFAAIDMSTEGPGVGWSYSQAAFPKVLITGHRGCGKTTELNALADRLRESGYFVVQVAADQLLDLSEVGWQDLLLELAYQVFEQGSGARRELRCAPDPGLHEQVYQVLDSTILKSVATTALEGKLGTEIEAGTPAPFLRLKGSSSLLVVAVPK